ncbi:methylmalonyl-CoA mutase family protein [Nocardioides sp. B-3]|nr:methylmalonyl-CoA mutase family protein [Nocardioides sp. B-3]UUZ61751.1 methylmalonyl-CoA mutase family protein [Nocardioides sp. B-3]
MGEMRRLFEDIPLTGMNTSMTINATAMWLLAMYQSPRRSRTPAWRRPRSPTSSRARPRTTSSRNTSRAGPTSSRPSTRCA